MRPIPYAWPFENPDPVLQRSLDITIDYLEVAAPTRLGPMTEVACARVILDEWLVGGRRQRHPLWLANKAIVAIETNSPMLGPVAIRAAGPRFL